MFSSYYVFLSLSLVFVPCYFLFYMYTYIFFAFCIDEAWRLVAADLRYVAWTLLWNTETKNHSDTIWRPEGWYVCIYVYIHIYSIRFAIPHQPIRGKPPVWIGRWVDRLISRLIARSLDRSLGQSLSRSVTRSSGHSVGPSDLDGMILFVSRYWVGGDCHPNFTQNSFFFLLSTVRAKPGSPQLCEPYCPPNAVQNRMLDRCTKSVLLLFCRLSVPSLGRPFHHFERQSFQCASKLRFLKLALMPQALFFFFL